MDIFEIIEGDHADIRRLLNEVIHQTSARMPQHKRMEKSEDWEEALHDLKLSVVAHNRAEEATLYDHLRWVAHQKEIAEDKTCEHRMVEEFLEDLERLNPMDRDWDTRLGLLKNQIESHQAEEETATFDVIRPHLDAQTSGRLAQEFTRIHDDIVEGAPNRPKWRSVINPAGLDL